MKDYNPKNASTGKFYTGNNKVLLNNYLNNEAIPLKDNRFLTRKQALTFNYKINENAVGINIKFCKYISKKTNREVSEKFAFTYPNLVTKNLITKKVYHMQQLISTLQNTKGDY